MYTLLKSILIVALGATLSLAEESLSSELNITLPLDPPNCKGQIIKRGVDTNGNGLLDDSEITSTVEQYDEGIPITIERLRSMVFSKDENLSSVNTCKIRDMSNLFYRQRMIGDRYDISGWNVGSVTNMSGMFIYSTFSGDISSWDVSNVTNMSNMFTGTYFFKGDISAWDVSNVVDMSGMFLRSEIDPDIGSWDVSSVTNMSQMFFSNQIQHDINSWDVSSVTNMSQMFSRTRFNKDIGSWDVSSVTNMKDMFSSTHFNKDISSWDVSSVTDMSWMFSDSKFNQDIGSWDVSGVNNMSWMFSGSKFDQDIGSWDITKVSDMSDMFYQSGDDHKLSTANYNSLLKGWSSQNVQRDITINMGKATYFSDFLKYKNRLINDFGWKIIDGNLDSSEQCVKVLSLDKEIDFGDVSIGSSLTKEITIHNSGTCTLKIKKLEFSGDVEGIIIRDWRGEIPAMSSKSISMTFMPKSEKIYHINLLIESDKTSGESKYLIEGKGVSSSTDQLTLIEPLAFANCKGRIIKTGEDSNHNGIVDEDEVTNSWDQYDEGEPVTIEILKEMIRYDQNVTSINTCKIKDMSHLFKFNTKFSQDISGWNVGGVTTMKAMFFRSSFNQDISSWDVSHVTDMESMFYFSTFNHKINRWDVSRVTNMRSMFSFSSFNQNISSWDVSSVVDMRGMFWDSKFNRDIGYWDVSSVTDMDSMFAGSKFNQNIGEWDVSNVTNMRSLFSNTKISSYNYSRLLKGWSSLNLQENLILHMGRSRYSPNFKKYKDLIIDKFGWNIIDGGENKYDDANYEDTPIDCTKILSFDKHLNFGEVAIGTFATRELTLYNLGSCPLSITNLRVHESIEGIFLGSWRGEIAPNSSQTIPIVFMPKKEQEYGGLIYVDSDKTNGGDSSRLLQGRGLSATDELMTISSLSPSNCRGRLLKKGEDKNHNGILDESEVIYTIEQYDEGTPITITTLREMITQKKDVTNINSCKITDMSHLFYRQRDFIQDISRWNVGSVTDMSSMFENTRFDPDISSWDTSHVVTMSGMFRDSIFNRDISSWDLSHVTNMQGMFSSFSHFNQDISGWDVSHVTSMIDMFRRNLLFTQDISGWDLSLVQDISGMFEESAFDQDISSWDVTNIRDISRLFKSSKLSTDNYNALLEGWSGQDLQRSLTLDMGDSRYSSDFQIYRDILVDEFGWKIIDGGVKGDSSDKNCTKILTFDKHINFGEVAVGSDTTKELVLYNRGSCDLTIDQLRVHESIEGIFIGGWNGRIAPNSSKSIPITFVPTKEGLTNGLIYVDSDRTNGGDSSRLLSGTGVERKEGDSLTHIESLPHANCKGYLIKRGIDRDDDGVLDEGEITSSVEQYTKRTPVTIERLRDMVKNGEDLTLVNTCKITDMSYLFEKSKLDQDISLWNVGSVTNMEGMFKDSSFNRDISRWNTSRVINMSDMFKNSHFNQKIGDWNTSSVTTMRDMFSNYSNFNQNIDSWDVSNVTDMSAMFEYNFVFNQDLGSWDVSHVSSMKWMFANTPFNQDISSWDTSSVTTMRGMFSEDRIFNQDLSSWDISNVTDIAWMFVVTRFDYDISSWDISSVKDMVEIFEGVTLSTEHYDAILNVWSTKTELRDVMFDVGWSRYSKASREARDRLINELGWKIQDGGFRQ